MIEISDDFWLQKIYFIAVQEDLRNEKYMFEQAIALLMGWA